MRHKLIIEVFTRIYGGRQIVGFELDKCDKYIFLSPVRLNAKLGIDITEVEILTGSKIRPTFYQIGEKMINDTICNNDNIVKDFWITTTGSVDEMRVVNKDKLKHLKTIKKVFIFNRNNKDIVGFDTGDEKATYIEAKRLTGLTKLNIDEFKILENSYINPEYYHEGDTMTDGDTCRKSGVLLKALNLRYKENKEQMKESFEKNSNNFKIINKHGNTYNDYSNSEEGIDYAYNPLDGDYYDSDWISDVFGMSADEDIPWGNID